MKARFAAAKKAFLRGLLKGGTLALLVIAGWFLSGNGFAHPFLMILIGGGAIGLSEGFVAFLLP